MIEFSPIITPFKIIVSIPMKTLSDILIGRGSVCKISDNVFIEIGRAHV